MDERIKQILNQPNPNMINIFQKNLINMLEDENLALKAKLEEMTQYAVSLLEENNKLKEPKESKEKKKK